MSAFKLGQAVRVRRPLVRGRYGNDEWSGRVMYVVGVFADGMDYKLASHPEDDWEVIIHVGRLTRAREYD